MIRKVIILMACLGNIGESQDTARQAFNDAATICQSLDLPHVYRFIWIQNPDFKKLVAVKFAVNTAINPNPNFVEPQLVDNGRLMIYDLRSFIPNSIESLSGRMKELDRIRAIWEMLEQDPYFHLQGKQEKKPIDISPILGKNAGNSVGGLIAIGDGVRYGSLENGFLKTSGTCNPGKYRIQEISGEFARIGTKRASSWIRIADLGIQQKKTVVIPAAPIIQVKTTYGIHLDDSAVATISSRMSTNAAVTEYRYFIHKILTTLNGGLYYHFTGLIRGGERTSQDQLLESLGVDLKRIRKAQAEQITAQLQSGVTSGPRRILIFQGSHINPTRGSGVITLTQDVIYGKDQKQAEQDPIRTLDPESFEPDGGEWISEKPNGLHLYALFDKDGKLVDVAPPNLANDRNIPNPFPPELQPAISCIGCHGPDRGMKPIKNDIGEMLRSSQVKITGAKLFKIQKLYDTYSGDFRRPVSVLQKDYDVACIRSGLLPSRATTAHTHGIYTKYRYDLVDAKTAIRELTGINPPSQKSAEIALKEIFGSQPVDDPYVLALMAGKKIIREKFETVYLDMARRMKK